MTDVDVVRASIAAYEQQDVEAAQRIFAPQFRFTSPQDDHIDKAEWLEKCFPTADRFVGGSTELELVSTASGVLRVYEYELEDGARWRNAELLRIEGDQIVETQVFFGGQVGGPRTTD